jgi:hypothetical protein
VLPKNDPTTTYFTEDQQFLALLIGFVCPLYDIPKDSACRGHASMPTQRSEPTERRSRWLLSAHLNAEKYVDAYLDAAGIAGQKNPLFRSIGTAASSATGTWTATMPGGRSNAGPGPQV